MPAAIPVRTDARKQVEARIAEAETRWNFALAGAGQGVWDLASRTFEERPCLRAFG